MRARGVCPMTPPHAINNVEFLGRVFARREIEPRAKNARPSHRARSQATQADARLPETGFLRLPEVLALFPVSRSHWWAGIKAGKFPAAVKLGPNTTAWRAEDIRRLIQSYAGRTFDRAG
jgi:predicted DNA-binding transcriptional regulator AlpA